jgi:hypothetical protein
MVMVEQSDVSREEGMVLIPMVLSGLRSRRLRLTARGVCIGIGVACSIGFAGDE